MDSNSLFDQVKYIGFLGKGSQGSVKGYELPDGSHVAIKNIILDQNIIDSGILTELNSLQILKGKPYINQLLGVKVNNSSSIDIMTTQHSGDLGQFISLINQEERIRVFNIIINQLFQGLYYIHDAHIIHRDIKPNNIFIDFNFDPDTGELLMDPVCYYADFGLSLQLPCTKKSYELHSSQIGTHGYRAPELLKGYEDYMYQPDIWALGITLLNYLTDDLHMPKETDELQYIYSLSNKEGIDVKSILKKHLITLDRYYLELKAMLLFDIKIRVEITELVTYPIRYPKMNYLPKRGNIRDLDLNTYFNIIDWGINLSIQYHLTITSYIISVDLFERYLASDNIDKVHIEEVYLGCLSIGSKSGDNEELNLSYFKDDYNLDILRTTEILILEKMNYMYMSCDTKVFIERLYELNDPYSSLRSMYLFLKEHKIYPGSKNYEYLVHYLS